MHVPATARPTAAGRLGKMSHRTLWRDQDASLCLTRKDPYSRVPVIARKALASEEGFGSLLSTGEQCLLEASPRDL